MILKSLFVRNWKTTVTGIITGGALGYAGYATGNTELILAGATAAAGGVVGYIRRDNAKLFYSFRGCDIPVV